MRPFKLDRPTVADLLACKGKRQLTMRLTSNNVLNHPAISNIGPTVTAATYGLPIAASATRSLTPTARLNF